MKTKTIKGNIQIEINGVKYHGAVDLIQDEQVQKKAEYPTWGVRIDRRNSDPESAVEYIGAAAGYTPANGATAGSWENNPIFAKIRPCIMTCGKVFAYLDPHDFGKAVDGEQIGNLRNLFDTMIEFGKIYYRIQKDERYTYIEATDSDKSLADGFTDFAYSYNGKVRDAFYIGAYNGNIQKGKLRSVSGVMPTTGETMGVFRAAAQANGAGYEILPFNKLTLLQVLYILRYKSRNSQAALGKGLTKARDFGRTGATDTAGLYYGDQDATSRVKCHGIEDFWGNVCEWIDGFITTDKVMISDGKFNDAGKDYKTVADLPESVYGAITDIYGDNILGFAPKEADDETEMGKTHYCNYGSMWQDNSGCVPFFGGYRSYGAAAGAFFLSVGYPPSYAFAYIGARLCFCGGEE